MFNYELFLNPVLLDVYFFNSLFLIFRILFISTKRENSKEEEKERERERKKNRKKT